MAITPSVAPSESAPVSPIIKLAGNMLYHTNPNNAPTMTAHNADKMNRPLAKAIIANTVKAMIKRPPANPSRPSVIFTALAVAVITSINRGMYHQPIRRSPMPGKFI